jgi:hypothetical protein
MRVGALLDLLSDVVRRALNKEIEPHAHSEVFFGFAPLPPRGPMVTNALVDRLREILD